MSFETEIKRLRILFLDCPASQVYLSYKVAGSVTQKMVLKLPSVSHATRRRSRAAEGLGLDRADFINQRYCNLINFSRQQYFFVLLNTVSFLVCAPPLVQSWDCVAVMHWHSLLYTGTSSQ